jgi:hypothetical protein
MMRAALLVLLAPAVAAAVDQSSPDVSLVVPEAMLPAVRAQKSRVALPATVLPEAATLARALERPTHAVRAGAPPAGFARLSVRAPLTRDAMSAVHALLHATGGGAAACRLVVHAEAGLMGTDLDALAKVGPCVRELHVKGDPRAFAERVAKERQFSVVLEVEGKLPDARTLAVLAPLPDAFLAVGEPQAAEAIALLQKLGGDSPGLVVRANRGVLSDKAFMAARLPRPWPLHVVATGGLDEEAARDLRTLPLISVEVSLENAPGVPVELGRAVELLRQIAPVAGQPMPDAR